MTWASVTKRGPTNLNESDTIMLRGSSSYPTDACLAFMRSSCGTTQARINHRSECCTGMTAREGQVIFSSKALRLHLRGRFEKMQKTGAKGTVFEDICGRCHPSLARLTHRSLASQNSDAHLLVPEAENINSKRLLCLLCSATRTRTAGAGW